MKIGDTCYFIANNYRVVKAVVTSISGDFCVVKYDSGKGIRLRKSRLYKTPEEAQETIPAQEVPRRRANPYLYLH